MAKDVAGVLGYSDTKDAVKRHCNSPKILKGGETPPLIKSPYGTNVIPERNLYSLVIYSKLPAAEAFEECGYFNIRDAVK